MKAKTSKLFGGGALLLVALLLAAIPASASAKALLEFTEFEEPVSSGITAVTGLSIEQCESVVTGDVVTTPATKVNVTGSTVNAEKCTIGSKLSESGHVEETTWESSGKLKVKATMNLTYPGPCVYTFTKFPVAKITYPELAYVVGETTGKLNKPLSTTEKGKCEKKLTEGFNLYVQNAEEVPFYLELT